MNRSTTIAVGAGSIISLAVMSSVALIVASVLLRTFVISCIWDWYVTPFLHAPLMPMVTAFGISVLVTYMMPRRGKDDSDSWFWLKSGLGALFAAWIGTLFM